MDLDAIRSRFPALGRHVDGRPAAYLDGPGGTQVAGGVIEAMTDFLQRGGSNLGGPFATSVETGATVAAARSAVADLFNCDSGEVVFGQNMTSLTFAASRAIGRTWNAGDEVVVTRLDHDANITPWVLAAQERGATVRWVDFDPRGTLDYDGMSAALGPRTRLVAVTAASNALGTIVDIPRVSAMAHAAGALVYVDAVHYTPHRRVDVRSFDCDFLAASAYKFFGPHTGILYGKRRLLEEVAPYKVRPAPRRPPDSWETGTQSFESLAGVTAAVDYLAGLVPGDDDRRMAVGAAMDTIAEYERSLAVRFLAGAAETPGVRVYGMPGAAERTPTFGVAVEGIRPARAAAELGRRGIFVWSGHYYAVAVMERLGLLDSGGLLRIGFVHYNTRDEVDRVLEALEDLSRGSAR